MKIKQTKYALEYMMRSGITPEQFESAELQAIDMLQEKQSAGLPPQALAHIVALCFGHLVANSTGGSADKGTVFKKLLDDLLPLAISHARHVLEQRKTKESIHDYQGESKIIVPIQ